MELRNLAKKAGYARVAEALKGAERRSRSPRDGKRTMERNNIKEDKGPLLARMIMYIIALAIMLTYLYVTYKEGKFVILSPRIILLALGIIITGVSILNEKKNE